MLIKDLKSKSCSYLIINNFLVQQAWVIVLTCFLCNGLAMGINNAYGVIYVRLEKEMRESGDANAAAKACKPDAIYVFNINH